MSTWSIPPAIERSRMMQAGGFAVYERLMQTEFFRSLLEEALRLYEHAHENHESVSDQVEWRGGSPARRFLSVSGGDVQDAAYHAPEIRSILTGLCGVNVFPTGGRGTYTYYVRPGDHLAIHRDIEKCDLAMITCLHETHRGGTAGTLAVYPERISEPLSAIRAMPEKGCLRLRLLPGQTVLLFGGIVPHSVLPAAAGQARIVSILCYQAAPVSLPRKRPDK